MKQSGPSNSRLVFLWAALAVAAAMPLACSTAKVSPLPPLPVEPPTFTQVPHPQGLDLGDLFAIFSGKDAPAPASYKDCERDFIALRERTVSKEELEQGARELVRRDPVRMHWCFYSKFLELEDVLRLATYVDERQKYVLEAYVFLTPMARGFLAEFKDTRYLRWAVSRYRRLSEYVFYRRLELSPQGAAELVGALNPWTTYRSPEDQPSSVLEKYGLVQPGAPAAPASPPGEEMPRALEQALAPGPGDLERAPAQEPAQEPAAGPAPGAEQVPPSLSDELDPPDLSTKATE